MTANGPKKIRVVVADDSFVCRELLRDIVEADGDISVVGEAADGESAIERIAAVRPDLLMLDVEMPGLDGLRAVTRIMATTPLPILVVTARAKAQRDATLFEAIERGALEVVPKPNGARSDEAATLRAMVRRLATVSVVRHVGTKELRASAHAQAPSGRDIRIVGIGASAGGPSALAAFLARVPPDFPACIAIVQHMLAGFVDAFADYLRTQTKLAVEVARTPVRIRAGTVLVAADGAHMVARSRELVGQDDGAPMDGHRPAADVLLRSIADTFGANAVGVVLSGIGRDGTNGLLAMRKAGAITFAQDERTAGVYGMPRSARESGAAIHVLSPVEIADFVVASARARATR